METSKLTGKRIEEYLSEGKRFDGRGLDEYRDIEIETGVSKKAEGSARVKLGKTEVIVGVKLDTTEPYHDSPHEGNMMVTAELLPLSSPRIELGPPKFEAIILGRLVDRGIRESHFIDLEKLCIKEGEKVWQVFIDVYTINDDGDLLDAATIGAIVALKTARMPKYDEEEGRVIYDEHTNEGIPLTKEIPLTITAHKIGKNIFVDPTREEEDISEGSVMIGASADGEINSLQKSNDAEITVEEMDRIIDITESARKVLFKRLEKYLK